MHGRTKSPDLDAIITSPPFFDSTRFHTANWMRLWFAGWEASDFVEKPATFVDERQKRSFAIYDSIFSQGAERLKPGGYFGRSSRQERENVIWQPPSQQSAASILTLLIHSPRASNIVKATAYVTRGPLRTISIFCSGGNSASQGIGTLAPVGGKFGQSCQENRSPFRPGCGCEAAAVHAGNARIFRTGFRRIPAYLAIPAPPG